MPRYAAGLGVVDVQRGLRPDLGELDVEEAGEQDVSGGFLGRELE